MGTSFFRPAVGRTLPVGTSAREQAGKEGTLKCPLPSVLPSVGLTFLGMQPQGSAGSLAVAGLKTAPITLLPFVSLQAAERDNQNLEDKVLSLRSDIEESKYRQRHLKVELKSFLEVLDGKIDDLHDFRRGLSKLGTDN